jgi:hypothetical protein
VAETIAVHVPRETLGSELSEALDARRLHAELVEDEESCSLRVSFAEAEHDRLMAEVTAAIDTWLAERGLPLLVQRADGGFVLRPPAD